jgi:molybdopterin molybdotransferase
LIPHPQAQGLILQAAEPLPSESVPLDEALGRALSLDIRAERTVPPSDNSAMDGYAVRSEDTAKAPVQLCVVETVYAGQRPKKSLRSLECCRIMTGASIPQGADAVIMQEKTRAVAGPESLVEILEPVSRGSCVRARGEDAEAGALLLGRGTTLGIPELALALGQGILRVPVPRRPRVAILSTGDELCAGAAPTPDGIIDVNGPSLCLNVARHGGVPNFLGIAKDQKEAIRTKLEKAMDHDLVVTSAGASVGERDYTKEVLRELGVEIEFERVAIKPGKPVLFGRRGATLFLGLPGNPTSSLVTFELFVRPLLRRWLGWAEPLPVPTPARAAHALKKAPGIAHFVRVTVAWRDGELWASPLASQTSGAVRSASAATHLLHFPNDKEAINVGGAVELVAVGWTG